MDHLDDLKLNKENYTDFTLSELESIISKILLLITSLDDHKIDVFYKCVDQLYMLNADVLNGGFNQYFLNQEDQVEYAMIGLTMENAHQNRAVLKNAYDKYVKLYEIPEVPETIDLSEFDNAWEYIDEFYTKRLAFIVANIERFFFEAVSKQLVV